MFRPISRLALRIPQKPTLVFSRDFTNGRKKVGVLRLKRAKKLSPPPPSVISIDISNKERDLLLSRFLNSSKKTEKKTKPEFIHSVKKYPKVLAVPLTRRPLFPGFYKSLYIKDISVIKKLESKKDEYIGVFLSRKEEECDVVADVDSVYSTGVLCQITSLYRTQDDALTVVVYPHHIIKIESVNDSVADVVYLPESKLAKGLSTEPFEETDAEEVISETEPPKNSETAEETKAITSELLTVLRDIAAQNSVLRDQIVSFSIQQGGNAFSNPTKLAHFCAAVSSAEPNELQDLLETTEINSLLHKALVISKKELANIKLQHEISSKVDKSITRKQQEYFLREQLKGIKKELGMESDGRDKLVEKFKLRVDKLVLPKEVETVFDEEINKLTNLEPTASEFNVTRNYLDWITSLPWGKSTTDNFNIPRALKVLDKDHYGLKDVKDRILEFIATGSLRKSIQGKILCLVGPPGVGKTSVGKSIARSLGREFFRFSVGGLIDVAEIKGHRRTYVGAMPGKLIQALKKVACENPVIMIDEIDKIGKGHSGDPASALLELLDPEQNSGFLDHYMDIPVDLSRILFVCTANTLDTIPRPLLDRMEVIDVAGYVSEEKLAIAERYLIPAAKELSGLNTDGVNVTFDKDAIELLIKSYCRESGVRNLKKQIEKVFRKAAFEVVKVRQKDIVPEEKIQSDELFEKNESSKFLDAKNESKSSVNLKVENEAKSSVDPKDLNESAKTEKLDTQPETLVTNIVDIKITKDNLKDYVGSPVFTSDRMYEQTPVGVVMGLAWTSMGGSTLYMESIVESTVEKNGRLNTTGQMGKVMKESTTIAYSFAKAYLSKHLPEHSKFFDTRNIHLHVPEGATPKDGPSAGITMTTSLLSLALNKTTPSNIAMTGEITLTGKVLKIGGVKEKIIAAKRSGIERVILPRSNQSDWDVLPEYIKKDIGVVFVDWFEDVFAESLFSIPSHYASDVENVLIPHGLIMDRVEKLAIDIASEAADSQIVACCVLKGASVFFADLTRFLKKLRNKENKNIPLSFEFIKVKSYENTTSTGNVVISLSDEEMASFRGKQILIVEDIVDTGRTMMSLVEKLKEFSPASIKVVSLLLKRTEKSNGYIPDYVGFSIPDEFVVGYALDYKFFG